MSCFGLVAKKCKVLLVKDCWGSRCPFYKTQEQLDEQRRFWADRLRVDGRFDLIEKYHVGGEK